MSATRSGFSEVAGHGMMQKKQVANICSADSAKRHGKAYRNLDLPAGAVLTDNGREFCGTENRPCELHLDLNGIEHRRTKVRTPKTNGFVQRFNGTVLDELFRIRMRENFHGTVEALQADLDEWLVRHNTERPHLGYRYMGRRPVETVMSFVNQEGQVDA